MESPEPGGHRWGMRRRQRLEWSPELAVKFTPSVVSHRCRIWTKRYVPGDYPNFRNDLRSTSATRMCYECRWSWRKWTLAVSLRFVSLVAASSDRRPVIVARITGGLHAVIEPSPFPRVYSPAPFTDRSRDTSTCEDRMRSGFVRGVSDGFAWSAWRSFESSWSPPTATPASSPSPGPPRPRTPTGARWQTSPSIECTTAHPTHRALAPLSRKLRPQARCRHRIK